MTVAGTFVRLARQWLPTPFTIAVLLTLLTMLMALVLTAPVKDFAVPYPLQIVGFWSAGFWGLLEFAMQMMLMLILGHVLALTQPVDRLIRTVVVYCTTTARAGFVVMLATMLVSLFNWGLGLIFGAILARKAGDYAVQHRHAINYPLVGACGYSGLMVWHGGLSGSAPLKVAEQNHFLVREMGVIPLSETTFSTMNIIVTLVAVTLMPLAMAWLGRRVAETPVEELRQRLGMTASSEIHRSQELVGAEKLDYAPWLGVLFGGMILLAAAYQVALTPNPWSLTFLTPNFINFVLLGIGLVLYGSLLRYMEAVEEAIAGAAGIMIQFPLYAGIAGVMQHSGLIQVFSDAMIHIANARTYPVFAFWSAGLVNMFVPSGGGQWAVQGPILVEASRELGVAMPKAVMALVYGDQLTNMLQPFWALPLLGITRLTAQEILPFSFYCFLLGLVIFTGALLIF